MKTNGINYEMGKNTFDQAIEMLKERGIKLDNFNERVNYKDGADEERANESIFVLKRSLFEKSYYFKHSFSLRRGN